MKSFAIVALIACLIATVSCAPQFGFPPASGSAANAGSQSFGMGMGGPHGGGFMSGSAAHAGAQSFNQGGHFGGMSGSAANAGSQSFSQGGGFGHFGGAGMSGSAANANAQGFGFGGWVLQNWMW